MISKSHTWGGVWSLDGPQLKTAFLVALALIAFTWAANADTWTGAGQVPTPPLYLQIRDWNDVNNWTLGAVPPGNDQNTFTPVGEGTIELNGQQLAGAMIFNNFTYTIIAPGVNPIPPNLCDLTMVNPLAGGSRISMSEGVRDTYGVDYFTAGPEFKADVILGAPLAVNRVGAGANRLNAAMMFSGHLYNPGNNSLTYTGAGVATSLWISSDNEFNGTPLNPITIASGGGGGSGGYTLHLADAGRLDGTLENPTTIVLASTASYLGLQDNTGAGAVPPVVNQYFNWVKSYGGNVFADRSYQLSDIQDNTNNVLQKLMGGVTVYGGTTNFGTGSATDFGHTNNGYSIRLGSNLGWDTAPASVTINVRNGNLTQGRGGSRYVSGANRLQEAHNYTYVENVSENAGTLVPFIKGGNGVLAVEGVNGGNQWWTSPQVSSGVLRLGTPTNPHNAPSVILNNPSAAVGFAWDTKIDLRGVWGGGVLPFPVAPAAAVPGQSGAVNIDLWGHGVVGNIVDPNVWNGQTLTYLRIGSSMGADATFDTHPNSLKHARTQGTIIPYVNSSPPKYYFGGGGGTLQVDSVLSNYASQFTPLEMGTTGNLLPGRIALNPGGVDESNTYTGVTDIWAGTLQLMKRKSLWGTSSVSLTTNCTTITNALYDTPNRFNNTSWKGPGQLLLDPVTDPESPNYKDWNLLWYMANSGGPLKNAINLDGGVIGWTNDVILTGVPGSYGMTINFNGQQINVLGLGGEYSAGTMTTTFQINNADHPVLLYKAGNNSKLDLRQTPGSINNYTVGTIIAGGEIIIDDPDQIACGPGGMYGGPIIILNGGKLHITKAGTPNEEIYYKSFAINTDGTPDLVKNCGSVLEIDDEVTVNSWALFDFSLAPTGYLEKTGSGTFFYNAQGPWTPTPGTANAWGLKFTEGLVIVNQLPVNPGSDSGPAIFNGGNLHVVPLPYPDYTVELDYDAAYGFRNIVSFKGTESTVTVADNSKFRTHGSVPNEILGTVNFQGDDQNSDPSDNVVHLSRNMSPVGNGSPGYNSRGNGTLTFEDVTVYMSGGGSGNDLNVLPQEAGFSLQLNDNVVFYASHQNDVWGEVKFNNVTPGKPVKIDGEEANPTPILVSPYLSYNLTPDTWTIYGTGLTAWSGTTEKVGAGTVAIKRSTGAPVSVNADTLLQISNGTFEAGGSADPFTDTSTGVSLDILNDSSLLISDGIKVVDAITGSGDTTINGPAGTQLTVTSIAQDGVSIASGCKLIIKGALSGPLGDYETYTDLNAVPEPSIWIMLILAGAGILGLHLRRR